jgi:hypothetical protein
LCGHQTWIRSDAEEKGSARRRQEVDILHSSITLQRRGLNSPFNSSRTEGGIKDGSAARVFVSSTYYDLKHIRASLSSFIDSLGYESVLSEKGDIAYAHDKPLDDSCYREASSADIFVLIVGGRYGSEASSDNKKPDHSFNERYDSIHCHLTWCPSLLK